VKKKLLFEEVMQYNKWVSGIASRELGTQRVTLKDLFDKSINQSPDDAKADKVLPYPLPGVIEQLGELFLNADNSMNLFKMSLSNPIIQKNPEAKKQVQIMVKKLDVVIKILKTLFKDSETPVAKK